MQNFVSKHSKKILWIIIIISVILRVGVALYMGSDVIQLPGISDQLTYHTLANRMLDGFPFSFDRPWWPATQANEPTAHWSYLYTYFLSFLYLIFNRNVLAARIFQVVLAGILQPLFLYLLAKNFTNKSIALIAAAWVAVYTYVIYYTAALMTESLFLTFLIAVFYFASEVKKQPAQWKNYILLGLFSAMTVLLRQVFLLFLPFLFLWVLWVNGKLMFRRTVLGLLISGLLILSGILPFTLYNYQRFQKFSLLNSNAGFAFYLANHPIYGTNFEGILSPETGNYLELLPKDIIDLDEISLDQALLSRGFQFIIDDPGRYVLLSLSRIPVLFEFWPSAESSLISNLTRLSSFAFALPFMLVGIFIAIKERNRKKIFRSEVFLILLFGLVYTGIHILSWSLIRYRLPIDILFLVFAATALYKLLVRLGLLKEEQI
jgi:4-amino-4-deoxy-L-arabinose transferase-like glycosyltransferase